jgi:hypothetical protein
VREERRAELCGPVEARAVGQRAVLMQVRTRVGELKAQGLSADNVASTVTSELQAKYPSWTTPNRVGAAARSFYSEMK